MTLLLILVFLLPILNGGILVHLSWPERDSRALFLKFFLGIGLGLGLWSLLYFLYMLLFAGGRWFIFLQTGLLLVLLMILLSKERKESWNWTPHWKLTRTQGVLLGFGSVVFIVSLLSTGSYLLRRKQGDWDAWMMFNRAARFFYRDPANWLESLSPQMDPIFHADYPLLLAMNTASGWETLGTETPHVPMSQSALFAIGCVGMLVSALALVKSPGQAALGLIILWGTPAVVSEGARELADLPLAFFILATGILIYLYVLYKKPGLVVLAGFTAALAAWTKNEGSVFVIGAGLALLIAFLRQRPWRALFWYAVGAVFPLAIVLYFKFFLAPPSDVLSNSTARSMQQIMDISRHTEILRYFWQELIGFGSWGIPWLAFGIIPILLVYYILFHSHVIKEHRPAYVAGITMLVVQVLGYYAVYLITPYDLTWHLSYSIQRIALQIFPLLAFLILAASRAPESIFEAN